MCHVDLERRFGSVRSDMVTKSFTRLMQILSGSQSGTGQNVSRLDHCAHFCVLVAKSFVRNRCPVRAAALSFATLLALIPMLAVAIGVTSSLLKTEGENEIYGFIEKVVSQVVPPATNSVAAITPVQPSPTTIAPNQTTNTILETDLTVPVATDTRVVTAQKEAARWIHEFIQNTQSGKLGLIGMLVLVIVAIRMLANIEETFNDIWGVTRGRSWLSRIILYWATITLGPLLLASALGLTSSPHFQATKGVLNGTLLGSIIFQVLPLVVLWLAFALAYQLVPNTKVRFGAALVGGIVGGTLWHLNSVFGFLYVSRVVSNSKIYGSLGLVPVFMAGVYFSWLILLFGAQIAYAFQNRRSYLQDKLIENVSQRGREFIALRLMTCIGQRFHSGQPPLSPQNIALELDIPSRLVQQVMQSLLAARLVVETGGSEPGYAPARPLDTINAHHVLHALRSGTGQELPLRDGPVRAEVYGEFARIETAEREAASALSLLALVTRAESTLALAAPPPEKKRLKKISSTPVESSAPNTSDNLVAVPVEAESEASTPAMSSSASKRSVTFPQEDREFPL